MKILQVCTKPPVPAVDGGCLAMNSITEGLLDAGHQVRVLAIETKKHPFLPEKISAEYKANTKIEAVFIDTTARFLPALSNLFSPDSYNVQRFYSRDFEKKLRSIIREENPEIIQLESIYAAPYISAIRTCTKAKIILRAHNVEGEVWQRRAAAEMNVLKKWWFGSLAKKISTYEKNTVTLVDAILPITEKDAAVFRAMKNHAPVLTFPYAMKLPVHDGKIVSQQKTVFHIGAMDWAPNREGLQWFCKKAWPLVLDEIPEAELHLAGKHFEKNDTLFKGKNIFVHGEVVDATAFMRTYNVMIVPLFSGGGMRIKLVEGMSLAKPVVTTTIGAEGIRLVHEKNALIADTAEKFAAAVVRYLRDENFAMKTGVAAQQLAADEHELSHAAKKLVAFYSTLLQ